MYIKELKNLSLKESKEITIFLKNMFDPQVKDFLFYQDPNYPFYFRQLINNGLIDHLFVLKKDLKIVGFAHFKIAPNEIFINNIAILPSIRSTGEGINLLKFALKELKQKTNCELFRFDVFEKNDQVVSWYKRIGMKETGKKYWYNVTQMLHGSMKETNDDLKVKQDENGFTGIYDETRKIATVVNRNLVFRDVESLNLFPANLMSQYSSACLITEENLSYELIDSSLTLTVELGKMKL
jgi:N-acetylglutamate synthase-like GNAT family acetyltransferase